jgi:hypothetical protein
VLAAVPAYIADSFFPFFSLLFLLSLLLILLPREHYYVTTTLRASPPLLQPIGETTLPYRAISSPW